MAGRQFNTANYRYGYQGAEKTDEISGTGNHYTTEFREADVRIGRWWSLDPITKSDISNYVMMSNSPIIMMDPKGDDDYYNEKGKYLYTDTKTSTDIKIITQENWNMINNNYSSAIADKNSSNLGLLKSLDQNSKTLTIKNSSGEFKNLWTKSQDGNERTGYIVLDVTKAEVSFKILDVKTSAISAPDPYKAGDAFEENSNQTVIANVHTHPEEAKYLDKFTDKQIFDAQYSDPGADGNTAKERGARYTIGVNNVDYHSPQGKSASKNNLTTRNKIETGKFNLPKHALEQYGGKKK
ncbi:MAG: hypothetical protein KF900_11780 [Bacteroidetes bacterium]|nr:hypothetical protein [Bacteroidota bacterium]